MKKDEKAITDNRPLFWVVTGPIGIGKTTWCMQLAELAREKGLMVGGILSPPVFKGERKIGIDLINLAEGDRRRLANERNLLLDGDALELTTRRWVFDPAVFAWGNEVLSTSGLYDLIFIDELGLLEFQRGQGFIAGFTLLDENCFRQAIVVIRPGLLNFARNRWKIDRIIDLSKTRIELKDFIAEIVAFNKAR
jgi:nucleoside-triphosphatase THEP1